MKVVLILDDYSMIFKEAQAFTEVPINFDYDSFASMVITYRVRYMLLKDVSDREVDIGLSNYTYS